MPDPRRVGIDDALLANNIKNQVEGEELFEMMNGCICCTVRQELVEVMKKLAARAKAGGAKLDAVVIETTGLADVPETTKKPGGEAQPQKKTAGGGITPTKKPGGE